MTTIYQVAEKAGVSLSTVSRVLNGKSTVNAEMAKKVKAAAEALAYKPNQNARSLAAKHANTVGIVLPNQNMQFNAHLLFSIEQLLRKHQKRCLIAFFSDTTKSEEDAVSYLHLQGCDGNIVFSMQPNTQDKALYKKSKNLVFSMQLQENNTSAIKATAHTVVLSAFHYLTEYNHRDIAVITHKEVELDATCINATSSLNVYSCDKHCANNAVLELVSSEKPFSALICTSLPLAVSAYALLNELGFKVPDDVSVIVACPPGDISLSPQEQLTQSITTFEFSTFDIAHHIVKAALENFYGIENKSQSTLLPVLHDYGTVSAHD